jgi:hypothetical protein
MDRGHSTRQNTSYEDCGRRRVCLGGVPATEKRLTIAHLEQAMGGADDNDSDRAGLIVPRALVAV